jgi:hypothetical protein
MTPEKTFREALAELVEQFSKRHEETHNGYLVELKSGEYLEVELHDDTNDLDEFMDRDEDEVEEKTIHLCSYCFEEFDEETDECCAGYEVASMPESEVSYYKFGM